MSHHVTAQTKLLIIKKARSFFLKNIFNYKDYYLEGFKIDFFNIVLWPLHKSFQKRDGRNVTLSNPIENFRNFAESIFMTKFLNVLLGILKNGRTACLPCILD